MNKIEESILKAKEVQKKYNAFVTILDKPQNDKKGVFSGTPYALKDNFSTKGILTTGSSNSLKDYVPVFNASVVSKLEASGAVLIGKTVMDEFGMGGTGTTGHTGVVLNPWNPTRLAGGSSAGSAVAVACGVVPFALGTDTGDSIRKPSAYCGVVGYKPTYGLVSRYGVFPYASSLDHVGVIGINTQICAKVIETIKGKDKYDMTTFNSDNIHLDEAITKSVEGKKLFVIKELTDINNYFHPTDELKETINFFNKSLAILKEQGVEVYEESFDLNLLKAIFPAYLVITTAEASSNYSNLTGIIFGEREKGNNVNETIKNYRTKGFSSLIKRRFVIGSYVLQKENQERYFLNACRVRRLIVKKMKELFKKYDAFISPASEGGAPLFSGDHKYEDKMIEVLENYMYMANFGGFPSICIPNGFVSNLPIGIVLTADVKEDAKLLNIAYNLEQKMPYKNQVAKGWEK